MMEYINRETAVSGLDKVIENLRKEATTHLANRAIDLVQYSRDYIQNLPAADVAPVVRCRECKHWNVWEACGHPKNGWDSPHMGPDDFCSYGERSTNTSTEK